jgi:hypothetical protein
MSKLITPEIWRAALAQVTVEPPAPRSLLRVILDAIELGYAKLELAPIMRALPSRT